MRLGDIQGDTQHNMRLSVFFILSVMAAAVSCSPRVYPVQRDTVTVTNTIERVEWRDSIIEVPVPVERVSEVTDTASVLETSVAVSRAEVVDGQLHHSLRNKEGAITAVVRLPYREVETTRDNKVLVRDVQLVEKDLSWWQRTVQIFGYAAMLILLAFIVIKSLKWAKILRK